LTKRAYTANITAVYLSYFWLITAWQSQLG